MRKTTTWLVIVIVVTISFGSLYYPGNNFLPSVPSVKGASPTIYLIGYFQAWNNSQKSGPNPTITVNQGDSITIQLSDGDAPTPHRFLLDLDGDGVSDVADCSSTGAPDVCSVQFTTPTSVRFTATTTGSYMYYCTVHPTTMLGTFTILPAPPDYAVSSSPSSLTIVQGSNANSTITASSINNFAGTIRLSATSSPSGPSTNFNATIVMVRAAGTAHSKLTVSTTLATPANSYIITVTARNSTAFDRTTTVTVSVVSASLVSLVVGSDGGVYWSRFVSSWTAWASLGGATLSPPGLCSSGPGRAEAVVRGADNGIFHKSFSGTTWYPTWDSPGGFTVGQPACTVLNNVLYVVVVGTDYGLFWNSLNLSTGHWSSWSSLSGFALSAPALVASPSSGRLDLVVRGTDNGIYHKMFASGAWSASWDGLGGFTRDIPTVIGDSSGIDLAVRGMDNSTYYNQMVFGGSWSGWLSLSGFTSSAPVLAIDTSGIIHLVVRGTNNGIYHKERNLAGTWSTAWDSPGGLTIDRPGIAPLGTSLALVARGSNNGIYYASLIETGWSSWTGLVGTTPAGPSLLAA